MRRLVSTHASLTGIENDIHMCNATPYDLRTPVVSQLKGSHQAMKRTPSKGNN